MAFNTVSRELVLAVADLLPTRDLSHLSRTCHQLHNLLDDHLLARIDPADLVAYLLRKAIFDNNIDTVRFALSFNPPWHDKHYSDCSVISYTAQLGHIDILSLLLNHFIEPESAQQELCHNAPLIDAIQNRDLDMFILLLSRGVDPNHTISGDDLTPEFMTEPLDVVAEFGTEEMARLLFEYGAEHLNRSWSSGCVGTAVSMGNWPVLRVLLENGVEVDATWWTSDGCEGRTDDEVDTIIKVAVDWYNCPYWDRRYF